MIFLISSPEIANNKFKPKQFKPTILLHINTCIILVDSGLVTSCTVSDEKRNFVSPRSHVISSVNIILSGKNCSCTNSVHVEVRLSGGLR